MNVERGLLLAFACMFLVGCQTTKSGQDNSGATVPNARNAKEFYRQKIVPYKDGFGAGHLANRGEAVIYIQHADEVKRATAASELVAHQNVALPYAKEKICDTFAGGEPSLKSKPSLRDGGTWVFAVKCIKA